MPSVVRIHYSPVFLGKGSSPQSVGESVQLRITNALRTSPPRSLAENPSPPILLRAVLGGSASQQLDAEQNAATKLSRKGLSEVEQLDFPLSVSIYQSAIVNKYMNPNKNLHVVLVRAENPLNIGQSARAMRNFGVSHLSLVQCAPHQTNEAYTVGWRGKNILDKAVVCKSLKTAVRKFDFVVGFTARSGRRRGEPRSLIDAAPQIIEALKDGKVALVFGNEKNGLSNSELRCCHETVVIPADAHYPTLNLSHAAAVVLFAIAGKNFDVRSISKKKERFFATLQDFEELIADFRRTLILLDYQKSKRSQLLERTLENISRLLKKAGLDKREYHLFKAFLSRINQKILPGPV